MKGVFAAAVAAAAVSACVWWGLHKTALPPETDRAIESLSYNFVEPETDPHAVASSEQKRQLAVDLALLSKITKTVRLYAASGSNREVPAAAARQGLGVIVGAWVAKDTDFTKREIDAAVDAANRISAVKAVGVGNEAIMRQEVTVDELIAAIRQVRQRVSVPVTTGETWDIWLKHPELAREVDYISAHILPYWEGIPADMAVSYAFTRYNELREAFPGKKVVIAEFGWPSRGHNNRKADTGNMVQATMIREFLQEAHRRDVSYNIIEAFDQPWKVNEGSVGAYWGIYNADRQAKFSFKGEVYEDNYWLSAGLANVIGYLISIASLALIRRRPTFLQAFALSIAAQALAAGVAMALLYPVENYLNVGAVIAWSIGFILMLPLTAMTLIKVHEVAELALGRTPQRLLRGAVVPPDGWQAPKVSIHIPAYRENPRMLIETLDSVAALDYPNFEALVIVNNTPEEEYWRPIEAHCKLLGDRFKFVFLPKIAGFKSGALNAALAHMAPETEVIALLDADYVVSPDWLKNLVPAFADGRVGLVQAPQDHRDGKESLFKAVMNSEYAGFFDIGMVQRNEDDAIVIHGTMLLIRRSAFEQVGGWSTETITEDTELGLRILRAGYRSLYTNRRHGYGMLPDSFQAYKTQRERWAYGAVQILRMHWRAMLPGNRSLTPAQKFQFLTGWSFWLSDSIGVIAAYLNLMWTPMILFVGVLIPTLPFTVPILAMFAVNIMHCGLLYSMRVRVPPAQILGAAVAAMSLQMTVAKAVFRGFRGNSLVFKRTDKGGQKAVKSTPSKKSSARLEGWTGVALLVAAFSLYMTNYLAMVEVYVFALTLAVQGLPFLAAPLMVWFEKLAKRQPAPMLPKQAVASPAE